MQLAQGRTLEPFNVRLYEAKAGDPKVPQGKPFAVLATTDLGLPEASKITCTSPHPVLTYFSGLILCVSQ